MLIKNKIIINSLNDPCFNDKESPFFYIKSAILFLLEFEKLSEKFKGYEISIRSGSPPLPSQMRILNNKLQLFFEEIIVINDDVIFGGVKNVRVVFEKANKQYPCFVYNEENPIKAIIPGVTLPLEFEKIMQENIKIIMQEQNGFTKDLWGEYMSNKPNNSSNLKPEL